MLGMGGDAARRPSASAAAAPATVTAQEPTWIVL